MTKREISQSETEESEGESESEGEEEKEVNPKQKQQGMSEYEKQRLSRIAENRARMEALGLSKMASSLMGSSRNSSKLKGKRKVVEDDEDYKPNDEDDNDGEDDDDDDDNDDELDDDDDFPGKKTPKSQTRKNKVKNKGSKPKKAPIPKHLSSSDHVDDDDDDELMKAIALSLQESKEVSGTVHTAVRDATFTERKGNERLKRKKSFTSRLQMTEDEMVAHFFQFDEAGKGGISMRDIQRVAVAHDFIWTDKELSDMIHCFDSDGDRKLNLDDFRKIVSKCKMLRTSENS